jgi:hypothetical protein
LVEEQTTTLFIGPADRLTVDDGDNFMIDIAAGEARDEP